MHEQPIPEFSRIVVVDELERGDEISREIEAGEEERRALAGRLDLMELGKLAASVTLRRVGGGEVVQATGRLEADVVQRCVVTLAPVPGHIEEEFAELFAPEGYRSAEHEEEEDLPEYFDGRQIDIGEMVAQLLSLALDPYPRAADAGAFSPEPGESDHTAVRRPFEGLAEMLKKRG
jgi:uncharacterized metal-binding protein YceD (DUF177 family)